MAAGDTTTQSLADSLPTVIASARQVREQEGVVPNLVDKVTLGEGTGISWNEVSMAQLTAQTVTETTRLDNPQQMSDTLLTITPTVVGIHTLITDRVAARISKNAYARVGGLAQNAIQRKKDEDGLTAIDGASTTIGSSGAALTTGHIAAAVSRISSDADEPGNPPYRAVLHGFQIKDLYDAVSLLSSGNPSGAPLTDGLAARVFQEGFRGRIHNCEIYEDGNIDASSNAAKGGVFAQEALILVQGRSPRTETRREPHIGGGSTSVFLYDEYAYGERSAGNWLYEIHTDATAPTT